MQIIETCLGCFGCLIDLANLAVNAVGVAMLMLSGEGMSTIGDLLNGVMSMIGSFIGKK